MHDILAHRRRNLKRYLAMKRAGLCTCGAKARKGRVKCRRCAEADNIRAKQRYAALMQLVALAELSKRVGHAATYPHHD